MMVEMSLLQFFMLNLCKLTETIKKHPHDHMHEYLTSVIDIINTNLFELCYEVVGYRFKPVYAN